MKQLVHPGREHSSSSVPRGHPDSLSPLHPLPKEQQQTPFIFSSLVGAPESCPTFWNQSLGLTPSGPGGGAEQALQSLPLMMETKGKLCSHIHHYRLGNPCGGAPVGLESGRITCLSRTPAALLWEPQIPRTLETLWPLPGAQLACLRSSASACSRTDDKCVMQRGKNNENK